MKTPFTSAYSIDGNGNLNYQTPSGYGLIWLTPATGQRTYTWPDKSGTIALTSDISGGGGVADQGTATLSGGVIVVSSTKVKSNSIILVSYNTITSGGLGFTPGFLEANTIVAGTSFTITSYTSNLDNSTVNWIIINP